MFPPLVGAFFWNPAQSIFGLSFSSGSVSELSFLVGSWVTENNTEPLEKEKRKQNNQERKERKEENILNQGERGEIGEEQGSGKRKKKIKQTRKTDLPSFLSDRYFPSTTLKKTLSHDFQAAFEAYPEP